MLTEEIGLCRLRCGVKRQVSPMARRHSVERGSVFMNMCWKRRSEEHRNMAGLIVATLSEVELAEAGCLCLNPALKV